MFIVKASRTGNTLSVCIPSSIRKEISIDQSVHFIVTAPSKDQIVFTRLNSDSMHSKIDAHKKEKKNALPRKHRSSHKH